MNRLPIVATMFVMAVLGRLPVLAAEPDIEKLFAPCVDASALVFGPDGTKEPVVLAGALVLDRDKRVLLAPDTNVPDALTVLFPAYTDKGGLRNKGTDYVDLWKKGDRWSGKVLHRDKKRDLAVIELERAPPDRAREAEFAAKRVRVGSDICALNQPGAGGDKVWELRKGSVRAIDKDLFVGPEPVLQKGPTRVFASAPSGTGPDFGLFDAAGRVIGFSCPPNSEGVAVQRWVDVTELREFLTEKKVPFRSAAERAEAKDAKKK